MLFLPIFNTYLFKARSFACNASLLSFCRALTLFSKRSISEPKFFSVLSTPPYALYKDKTHHQFK